jgi:hypothetical protein
MDEDSPIAPERGLRVTPEEYTALKNILEEEYSGFEVEYHDGNAFVFAPEWADCDDLPLFFFSLLGWFITKNGLDYLAFGPAADWDSPAKGIAPEADAYFRIRSNGSLWEPKLIW